MPVNYADGKIYTLVNDVNDTIYVGSTAQKYLCVRMGGHRRDATDVTKMSPIYTAMRELGINHFRIVLHHAFPCGSKDELVAEEFKVLKTFIDVGTAVYNARVATTGFKLSDEHKQKLSKAHLGLKVTDATKIKMSEAQKGKKLTQEHKDKIGEANSGFGTIHFRAQNGKKMRWVFQYYSGGKLHSQSFGVVKYGHYGAHFRAEEARRAVFPEWGNEEDIYCDDLGHIEWD